MYAECKICDINEKCLWFEKNQFGDIDTCNYFIFRAVRYMTNYKPTIYVPFQAGIGKMECVVFKRLDLAFVSLFHRNR